jgi:hypothetical protein
LTAASRAALAQGGAEDSWQGEAALTLARLIDAGDRHLAQLVKEHRIAMEFALRDSGEDADIIHAIFAAED